MFLPLLASPLFNKGNFKNMAFDQRNPSVPSGSENPLCIHLPPPFITDSLFADLGGK